MNIQLTDGGCIIILDQGKTNIKLSVATAAGEVLDARALPNPSLPGPPWRHHDLPAISDWVFDTMASLGRQHPLKRFISTGHGVGGLLVTNDPDGDNGGQALPMIDYEQDMPAAIRDAYAAEAGDFFDRGSAIMLGAAHQARQLYWMEQAEPAAFSSAYRALGLPQYWAWRLSGRAVCEWSHLGAQSHLYNVLKHHWSPIVQARQWERLLPPMAHAYDDLGPLRESLAKRYGLPAGLRVHAGAHDSTANFYRYQATGMADFTLVSTGTWIVAMADGIEPEVLDEHRGMTCNIDVYGRPLGGSLVMGGREFEHVAPQRDAHQSLAASIPDIVKLMRQGSFALPGFVNDDAQFPGSGGRGRLEGPAVDAPGLRWSLAVLYTALLSAECAGLLGADRPLVVDGAFTADPVFCELLAALMPGGVSVSDEANGVACGAALLAGHLDRQGDAAPSPTLLPVSASALDREEQALLRSYRDAWRERSLAV